MWLATAYTLVYELSFYVPRSTHLRLTCAWHGVRCALLGSVHVTASPTQPMTAVRDSLSGSISQPIGYQRSREGTSLTTISIRCWKQSNLMLLANLLSRNHSSRWRRFSAPAAQPKSAGIESLPVKISIICQLWGKERGIFIPIRSPYSSKAMSERTLHALNSNDSNVEYIEF